jgi:HEAT repeat protein
MLQIASAWGLVTLEPTNAEYVKLAVPELIHGLMADNPIAKKECAATLRRLGKTAEVAVPELLRLLDNKDASVRSEALSALAEINPKAAGLAPKAVALLDDDNNEVRVTAAYTLGRIGPDAKAGVAGLRQMLRSRDNQERGVAAWALVQIAPTPELIETAIPLFLRGLQSPNPEYRAESARTLGKVGGKRADVRTALETATKDGNESVRKAAGEALKKIGS